MSEKMFTFLMAGLGLLFLFGVVSFVRAEAQAGARQRIEFEQAAWEEREGPCKDSATLLATTAGSPNGHVCPNRRHRMRIQIASAPSNEEFGAVAFCECRDDGAADAGARP